MSHHRPLAPALHPGMLYVRTTHGDHVHVANDGAMRTSCGRVWSILLEYEPELDMVCERCGEMYLPLALALGMVRA